jgi:hypothetical protein
MITNLPPHHSAAVPAYRAAEYSIPFAQWQHDFGYIRPLGSYVGPWSHERVVDLPVYRKLSQYLRSENLSV